MAVTWGDLKTRISKRAHQNLSQQVSIDSVEEAAKSGIEMMENEEKWSWLKFAGTLTMTQLVYYIAWPDYLLGADIKSFRYGAGTSTFLTPVRSELDLDAELSPAWRTDTSKADVPKYIVEFGRQYWIAPMPSVAFIATPYTTLYFYGWRTDLYTIDNLSGTQAAKDATALLIPHNAVEAYTQASLICLLQERDDPDWKRIEQTFQQVTIPRMRRFKSALNDDTRVRPPASMTQRRF